MEDKLRELSLKYVVGIGIGLLVLYYFFYYSPPNELEVITSFEQQLVTLDAEIKKFDQTITESEQIKVELETVKNEIKALSSYFVIKPNAKSIEQLISDEARATGISFTTLQRKENENAYMTPLDKPKGPTATDYVQRSIIEASFSGTFTELMQFLSYLSRSDRIISLKEIQLKSYESQSSKKEVAVDLSFTALFETYEIIKDVNAESIAPKEVPPEVTPEATQ